MELYIFNQDIELLGIVDEIEEMDWNRKYYSGGDCLIKALLTQNNIELLKKGNLICKKNDFKDVMIINHREISDSDADGMELLVVEAISITTRILSSRITIGRQIEKGTADKIMENMLLIQTNHHSNKNRHIKRLKVDRSVKSEFVDTYEYNSMYKYLDEEFSIISEMDGCGHRIILDIDGKYFRFEAYKGKDKSDTVLFSTAFDNLTDQQYIESDTNYKNVAIVAGQGEELDRDLIIYNDEKYSDFERIELMVDARDIEQDTKKGKDENDNEIDIPVHNGKNAIKLLQERGKSKLEETSQINLYTASIVGNNYEYRKDYDLGDLVSIKNEKWGISYIDRITEINEQYDQRGMTVAIEFGKELPTLSKKINQKMGRM